MITLLRKIRKQLLSKGQFSSYLLYAIGEILLVVIGILIALQINNWNENNQEEKKQTYYLQSLKSDLQANDAELERVIKYSQRTISLADSLLRLSEKSLENIELKGLTTQILNAGNYSIFKNKSTTVRELMATGDLKLIKSDSLRSYVANWESEIEDIRSYELPNTENSQSYFKFVMKHLDVYKGKLNKPPLDLPMLAQLFANREFMNGLAGRASYPKWLAEQYSKQKEKTEVLLKLINKELERE